MDFDTKERHRMCNHETKVAQDRLPPHLRLFTFHLFYQRIHTHARAKNESDITNKRTWRIRRAPSVTSARVPSGMPPTGCFSFPSLDALTPQAHVQTAWPTQGRFLQVYALPPTPPPHWAKDSRRRTVDKGDPRRRTRRTRTLRSLRESKED